MSANRSPAGRLKLRHVAPEARDVMQVPRNETAAPEDLRLKALHLAGRVIELDPDVRGGRGFAVARDILESGCALAKMEAIIEGQGVQSKVEDRVAAANPRTGSMPSSRPTSTSRAPSAKTSTRIL